MSAMNPLRPVFWTHAPSWRRAATNTTRCLVGCSLGDFGTLFALQHHQIHLSPGLTMASCATVGLMTSFALETTWLNVKEKMDWSTAAKTASGMSLTSMLAMELVETSVDMHLTHGVLSPGEAWWWGALGVSLLAGFTVPLPIAYRSLRLYGKSCCAGGGVQKKGLPKVDKP